ncbi:hypothetical protein V8E36_005847 [Tilletia maclaganii]
MTTATAKSSTSVQATSQIVTLPAIILEHLRNPDFLDALVPVPVTATATASGNVGAKKAEPARKSAFMDALAEVGTRTRTTNGAPALNTTGSPTLDAFNGLWPNTPRAELESLLARSWKADAGLTLRLIWNLRSIPDGKGNKTTFYRCWAWLFRTHPRTALSNLDRVVEPLSEQPRRKGKGKGKAVEDQDGGEPEKKKEYKRFKSHGYWKDLLNLLVLAVKGQLDDPEPEFLNGVRLPWTLPKDQRPKAWRRNMEESIKVPITKLNALDQRARDAGVSRRQQEAQERFEVLERALAARPAVRALYIAVARLFADRLLRDIELMERVKAMPAEEEEQGAPQSAEAKLDALFQISLAGKWAPSPGGSHDRLTNISTAIALLVRDGLPKHDLAAPLRDLDNDGSTTRAQAHVLRSFFQRWVLRELRDLLELPEPKMAAGQWADIRYRRVASVAMSTHSHLFFQHDKERFKAYVAAVEGGKTTISGATLMPHEIIARLFRPSENAVRLARLGPAAVEVCKELGEMQERVMEAQWNALVQSLREAGSLGDALAICDVSGSMGSVYHHDAHPGTSKNQQVQPILPALALSLIIASLSRPPFDSGFITFSTTPAFVKLDLEADSLKRSAEKTLRADAGLSTNFRAVFLDLLLPMALERKLSKDEMVKRLFVFSDMQFDAAHQPWETTYDAIERAYAEAGYEVPQLVFWDLAGGQTVEVQSDRKGVAMMSGFSPAMVKVFMGLEDVEEGEAEEGWEKVDEEGAEKKEEDADFNPVKIMEKALLVKSFDTLKVVD